MSVKGQTLFFLLGMVLIAIASGAVGQTTNFFPGGWIEKDGAGVRSRYSTAQLQSFIPPQRVDALVCWDVLFHIERSKHEDTPVPVRLFLAA